MSSLVSRVQAIEACRTDINYLGRICKPDEFKSDFPDLFVAIFNKITANPDKPKYWRKYLIAIPRGHAKTTFLELIAVWFLCFSPLQAIMVVCSTQDLADELLASIATCMEEPDFITLFGNFKANSKEMQSALKVFYFRGRWCKLQGKSAEGKLRGLKYISRPQLYLLDDLQAREDADSEVKFTRLKTWVTTTLLMGRHNERAIVLYCGNMYPTKFCFVSFLNEAKSWTSLVMGALRSNGEALWEALRSKASLLAELVELTDMGMEDSFITEMLNGKVSGLASGVDLSKIPQYEPVPTPVVGRFLLIDIATDKATADQCVIAAVDMHADRQCVVREVHEGKWAHDDLADVAVRIALRTQTPLICYEDVGFQHIMLKEIRKSLARVGVLNMQVAPVRPMGMAKNSRIANWFFKPLMRGSIRLHPAVRASVLDQIGAFNRLRTDNLDDIIDDIAYITYVLNDDQLVQMAMLPVNDLITEADTPMVTHGNTSF